MTVDAVRAAYRAAIRDECATGTAAAVIGFAEDRLRQKEGTMDLKDKIDDLFTYHAPEGEQPAHYEAIRAAAKVFARVVVEHTPASADQTAAVRKLRECVMTANAAIALKGLS